MTEDDPDLFGMHRHPDHETSIAAAAAVKPFRTVLQAEIYGILCTDGPKTDGELEELPQFAVYGHSTVRKRRSELYQAGRIKDSGIKRGRFIVWEAVRVKP